MDLKKIGMIIGIMFITLLEALLVLTPFNFDARYDAIYYYDHLKDGGGITQKHPLFSLFQPLGYLPFYDFCVLIQWIPVMLFNLMLFLLFGFTPWLLLSMISLLIVSNTGTAQMLSVISFCLAYHYRYSLKSIAIFTVSSVAHRFGIAWSLVMVLSDFIAKYNVVRFLRLTAIPLAIIWTYIAIVIIRGRIDPELIYEFCIFASFFFPFLLYFMRRSVDDNHVAFVWMIILISLIALYVHYVTTDDMPGFYRNIYDEYNRIIIMGLIPIILFFLARESKKMVLDGFIMMMIMTAMTLLMFRLTLIPEICLKMTQLIVAVCFIAAWIITSLWRIKSEIYLEDLPQIGYKPL